jgi:hypothetical protein
VWGLSGFDVDISRTAGRARLFGLVRDFGQTGRFRPSGLAVALLNQTVRGDYHEVSGMHDSGLSAYAFETPEGWALAAVSASPQPRDLTVQFPGAGSLPAHLYVLSADRPAATNEDEEEVRTVEQSFQSSGRTVTVEVPAWGLVVVTPEARTASERRTAP